MLKWLNIMLGVITSAVIVWAVAFVFFAVFGSLAYGQSYYSNRVGNYTYYNGNDEQGSYNGYSSRLGNYEYYNDNRGNHCTTSRFGQYTYTNCN